MLKHNADFSPDFQLAAHRAEFASANGDLEVASRKLLAALVADAPLHARFLNTLSLLEHMGSYKIMATQRGPNLDQATLKHLAEEAYHAYFMKHQAEKLAGKPLTYRAHDLLAPAAARGYFQRLEATLERALAPERGGNAVYLHMSMIVEYRALWFFEIYQQSLKRAGQPLSLKRVLAEEHGHLSDITNRLEAQGEYGDARTRTYLDAEKRLFAKLLASFERAADSPVTCRRR